MTRRKQRANATGSEAHYEDGRYYDQAYRRRRHDVRFYTNLAVESGGPVLELGAGTGRVALAIAKAGVEVVGVESESAARGVLNAITAQAPDIVCIGTHGMGRFEGLLGSLSTKIARLAPCPVLLIR